MATTDKLNRDELPQISDNPLVIEPCIAEVVRSGDIVAIRFGTTPLKSKKAVTPCTMALADCKVIGGWLLMVNKTSGRVFVPVNQNGNPISDFIGGSVPNLIAEIKSDGVDVATAGGLRTLAYQLSERNNIIAESDDTVVDIGTFAGLDVLESVENPEKREHPVTGTLTKTQIAVLFALAAAVGFGAAVVAKHTDKNTPIVTDTSTAP